MPRSAPRPRRTILATLGVAVLLLASPTSAGATKAQVELGAPVFGLATAKDGSLLVADASQGIVAIKNGVMSLAAPLPGVDDVGAIGNGSFFALTGGGDNPTSAKLWRVSDGRAAISADLGAFEAAANPDGAQIDSNPFGVAVLNGGGALVADAGANAILFTGPRGFVDWVATLPSELEATANIKAVLGCPEAPDEFAFVCGLPGMILTEAVPTSVAIGPDGAAYVSELKGFPGPLGASRIWRIQPGTIHARCGIDPGCEIVADGFTSIVDLSFGPDGTLYVTEIDESSFAVLEIGGTGSGGTVNACPWGALPLTCHQVATGLPMPIATTVGGDGLLYVAIGSLIPGLARVVALQ